MVSNEDATSIESQYTSSAVTANPDPRPCARPSKPLRGPWLFLARVAWVVVAALSLGLLVASVPARYETLRSTCTGDECAMGQLAAEDINTLGDLGLSLGSYAAYQTVLQSVFSAVFLAVGAVIFWRGANERMALLAAFILSVAGPALSMHGLEGLHPVWETVVRLFTFLFWASMLPFLYLFPDGRFVPRWTRWLALFVVTMQILEFFPDSFLNTENWPSPLYGALALGLWSTALFAQIYRYRKVSTPSQRQQTKWLVFGFAVAFFINMGFVLLGLAFPALVRSGAPYEVLATTLAALSWLLLPLSIGVAVLRYRLWDVDLVINRTLVYAALTACIVGIYVLAVGYLGAIFRAEGNLVISLVATGIVAVLFAPLKERLQRGVNRLMYGERDDPYAVLSRMGRRMEATLHPGAVLPIIAETVAGSLRLPYTAIALKREDRFEVAAEHGKPTEETLDLPLTYGPESVGRLILSPRAPGVDFTPADRRLLEDLARQVGVAAHAVTLTDDLQRSRERLVSAREEERRRLRRDLHDGVGPQLAGLTLKLETARNKLGRDPETNALLSDLADSTRAAVADIRRAVHDLRPPALDELGLLSALREATAQYALHISVEAPEEGLPPLPAAVEVATYRIAQEAVTNVIRHAGASQCTIRITLDEAAGALHLEVEDDGRGLREVHRGMGVGLSSMRERAEELGGTFVAETRAAGGTRIKASLPCRGNERPSAEREER